MWNKWSNSESLRSMAQTSCWPLITSAITHQCDRASCMEVCFVLTMSWNEDYLRYKYLWVIGFQSHYCYTQLFYFLRPTYSLYCDRTCQLNSLTALVFCRVALQKINKNYTLLTSLISCCCCANCLLWLGFMWYMTLQGYLSLLSRRVRD
jgi:hypothetical protein